MANEFKVKKGLIVDGSNTVLDIQGTQGQLFSVTDSLTGDLFSVSDVSGIPILNVNSSGVIDVDAYINVDGYINLSGTTTGYYIGGSGGGKATNELRIGSTTTTNTVALEIHHSANPVSLGIDYDGGAGLAFIESVHSSYDVNTHLLFKPGGTETWRIGSHGTASGSHFKIKPASSAYDFIVTDAGGTPIITADSSSRATTFGGTGTFEGGGNTLTLKKGTGTAALAFAGTSTDPEASALLEGIAGGGLKLYTSTSSAGTIADPGWSSKLTIAQNGDATFAGTITTGDNSNDNYISATFSDSTYTRMHGYGLYMSRDNSYIRPTTDTGKTLYIGSSDKRWDNVNVHATNATFSGNITGVTETLTGATSLLLTLNPTANNYGGIWFKYGGTSKGMSVYNSGSMVYGGESGVGTILQTNGSHALNIDTSQNATFAGNITFGDSHFIGDDSDDNLLIQSSANENLIINSPDDDVLIRTAGTTRLQITNTLATFSEDVTLTDGVLTVNPGNNRIKFSEGSNSIAQIGLRDSSTNEVFLQGWGSDFRIAVGGTYNNHALVIDNAKNTKLYGDLIMNEDGNEFWLKSTDYNLARIIPRGSSGVNLDKGLFSLMTSDGTTNNVEAVRIDSAGNSWFNGGQVGIGVGTPTELLHIKNPSNSWNQYARIRIGTETSDNYASEIGFHRGTSDDTDRGFFIDGGGSGTQHLKVLYTGNVGIGTVSPGAKLEVAGGADSIARVLGTTTAARLDLQTNSFHKFIQTIESDGRFRLYNQTTSKEQLTVTNVGSVGVGDAAPTLISANTYSLSVNSARNDLSGGLITKANGTVKHQQYWDSSGYSFNLSANSGDFKWKVNNNDRMVVDKDGGLDIQGTAGQLFSVTNSLSGDLFSVSDVSGIPIFNINSSGLSNFDGNVLVGKTAVNNALVGVQLMTDGSINPTVSGDTVARFNRLSSDGEVIRIQKDTATVGAIGCYNGVPWIGYQGGAGGGIMFNGASIEPTLLGSSRSSNTNDIGSVNYKWRYGYFGTALNTHDLIATNSTVLSGPGSGTSNVLAVNHGAGSHTGIGIKITSANSGHALDLTGTVGSGYARITTAYNNLPDFTISGTITAGEDVIAYSDIKLKENIKTLDGSKVYDMRGVSFTRKDTEKEGSGVIAQEMQKVAPELVNEVDGTLGVSYGNITGYLIEAIKDLKAEVEQLKKQIK